jgi:hypothetical protein
MQTAVTFDTLGYFEKLKAAGVPDGQAKVMTEVQAESLKDFAASRELATKADLMTVRSELVERIAASEVRVLRWMVGGFLAQTALLTAILAILK